MKTIPLTNLRALATELAKDNPDPGEVARQAMEIYLKAVRNLKLTPAEIEAVASSMNLAIAAGGGGVRSLPTFGQLVDDGSDPTIETPQAAFVPYGSLIAL